jgi:hypothetical protein
MQQRRAFVVLAWRLRRELRTHQLGQRRRGKRDGGRSWPAPGAFRNEMIQYSYQ